MLYVLPTLCKFLVTYWRMSPMVTFPQCSLSICVVMCMICVKFIYFPEMYLLVVHHVHHAKQLCAERSESVENPPPHHVRDNISRLLESRKRQKPVASSFFYFRVWFSLFFWEHTVSCKCFLLFFSFFFQLMGVRASSAPLLSQYITVSVLR